MDGHRFDDLTRSLVARHRRGATPCGTLLGGVLGVGAALVGRHAPTDAAERPERRPRPVSAPALRSAPPAVPAATPASTCRCIPCWPTRIPCGNACVDPLTDPKNCGDCGIVCATNEVCGLGFCGLPCHDNFDCPDDLPFHCTWASASAAVATSSPPTACRPTPPGLLQDRRRHLLRQLPHQPASLRPLLQRLRRRRLLRRRVLD